MDKANTQPKSRRKLNPNLTAWLVGLHSLVLFIFFLWGPLVQNIGYSFFETNNFDLVRFHGLNNYIAVFNDPRFMGALTNTVLYVIYSLLIGFIIPIILALLISEVVRGKSIFRVGFYIPNIVPAIAVILMWKIMMDPNDYGFFNIILQKMGLGSSLWLSNETMTIPLIILTLTWKSAGSTMLIYLATIQSIDNSLYEAARIKGIGVFKRLRYITLPALLKNVKLLLILQIISVFQIFYEPMIFMGQTNNSANTFGLLIYKYIYTSQNTGQAAALGVITMFFLLGFTLVYLYFDQKANVEAVQDKPYMTFEMLEEKISKREARKSFQIWSKIKRGIQQVGKWFYKALVAIKLIWLLNQINKFFNKSLSTTKTFGLRLFKKKNEGILTYSDYKKSSRRISYYVMHILLIGALFALLLPFIWLIFTSFKEANEILQLPHDYHFFPKNYDFSKIYNVIAKTRIMDNVLNSLIVALGSAACAVIFNGLLAYVIAILKPKGSRFTFYLVLGSMLIPPAVALVPLYTNIIGIYEMIASITGMSLRSVQASIIAYVPLWLMAGASPFNLLLFKTHFESLPKDLFEVAQLEGASKLQTFFKIVIPLSIPTIVVVAIFSITAAWNDFLMPYIIINNQDYWTVMIKIFKINAEMFTYGITLDEFLSLLLFIMIPPVILFFIFQKQISTNVATTGIK